MQAARNTASSVGRFVYHLLPLGDRMKLRLKDATYTALAPIFRGTAGFAAWSEERGPLVTPAPREAGGMAHSKQILGAADGRWEWASYEPVRAKMRSVVRDRNRLRQPVPRPVLTVSPHELRAAAASISLPDPGASPTVSIVIPVYGELKYTVECLLSIARSPAQTSFEVIVADDASPDETHDVLAQVAHLRVIRQPSNVGYIKNCNAAAKEARGQYIMLLNNDTQVRPGWLDAMAAVFRDEQCVGVVGPRIVYAEGYLQDAGVRVRRAGDVEMIGLNGNPEEARWSYRRDVDYISGACAMIEKSLFVEVGGLDESLAPAYFEDMELGLRLHERGLRSIYTPDAEVVHHLSVTFNAIDPDFKMRTIARNRQAIAERYQARLDALDDVRFVSFYLPQFHPFEQNDLWWGPGFTEWTNVAGAKPNWNGHYQPRLPADLGFYDLRLPETIEKQWELAARYGVDAFAYYYYWFAGLRLLDRPLERLLQDHKPAHPFCLCWANENWTRRWDGMDDDVLIAQQHSEEDDLAVIRDMCRYITNPAYIRVHGRPLVLVYRVDLFPDFARTAERWREECVRLGVGEIELAMVESFRFAGASVPPSTYGCDSAVEFPAHHIEGRTKPRGRLVNRQFAGRVADYSATAVTKATRPHPGYKLYRSVMPGWDNTARRQDNPFVLENSTPGAFQAWIETAIEETKRDLQGDDRLVFINAWNEWAEGAYLEPDQRFGHTYLEAVRNAREASRLERPRWMDGA